MQYFSIQFQSLTSTRLYWKNILIENFLLREKWYFVKIAFVHLHVCNFIFQLYIYLYAFNIELLPQLMLTRLLLFYFRRFCWELSIQLLATTDNGQKMWTNKRVEWVRPLLAISSSQEALEVVGSRHCQSLEHLKGLTEQKWHFRSILVRKRKFYQPTFTWTLYTPYARRKKTINPNKLENR